MKESVESMTLREKLTEADRLLREMVDHLENGFIPKTRLLSRALQEHQNNTVQLSDTAVRQQAAEVIDTNRFTERLYGKVEALLLSIDRDVNEIQGVS